MWIHHDLAIALAKAIADKEKLERYTGAQVADDDPRGLSRVVHNWLNFWHGHTGTQIRHFLWTINAELVLSEESDSGITQQVIVSPTSQFGITLKTIVEGKESIEPGDHFIKALKWLSRFASSDLPNLHLLAEKKTTELLETLKQKDS